MPKKIPTHIHEISDHLLNKYDTAYGDGYATLDSNTKVQTSLLSNELNSDLKLPIPFMHMPLVNNLNSTGSGNILSTGTTVTFTRSTTGTYIDRYGVLKTAAIDTPRFEKEGYLIEGIASANKFFRTTLMETLVMVPIYGWNYLNCTRNTDGTKLPDGTLDAIKVIEDVSGVTARGPTRNVTSVAGTTITVSALIKVGTSSRGIRIQTATGFFSDGLIRSATFDPNTGLVTATAGSGVTTSVLKVGSYYRVFMTFTPDLSVLGSISFWMITLPNTSSYAGDGTSYIYMGLPQCEFLPFGTSIIYNAGDAEAPRAAETLVLTAPLENAVRSDQSMTMLATVDVFGVHNSFNQNALSVFGESTPARILRACGSVSGYISAYIPSYGGGVGTATPLTPRTPTRLGWLFTGAKLSLWRDGVKQAEATPSAPLSSTNPTQIDIGGTLCGHISDVTIYGTSLDDYLMKIA